MFFEGDQHPLNPMRYLPTPFHTKFAQERTALSQYIQQEAVGTRMRRWERPLHDFLAPYLRGTIERLTGQNIVPAEVEHRRDLDTLAEVMTYLRALKEAREPGPSPRRNINFAPARARDRYSVQPALCREIPAATEDGPVPRMPQGWDHGRDRLFTAGLMSPWSPLRPEQRHGREDRVPGRGHENRLRCLESGSLAGFFFGSEGPWAGSGAEVRPRRQGGIQCKCLTTAEL